MKHYKFLRKWKRSTEDENVQLEALFDALYMQGKVNEDDLYIRLHSKLYKRLGYIYPKRDAAWSFLRYNSEYKGNKFWDKLNCYNNSPLDLIMGIYERTIKAAEHEDEGTATYLCTGAPAVNGTIVCMGKMENGQYITNPVEGAPREFVKTLNPGDITCFLGKYSKWLKDPLLMLGIWRTYAKNDYGPWMICLCHHLGTGQRKDFYEYGFDAAYNAIDYTGTEF